MLVLTINRVIKYINNLLNILNNSPLFLIKIELKFLIN